MVSSFSAFGSVKYSKIHLKSNDNCFRATYELFFKKSLTYIFIIYFYNNKLQGG